MNEKEIDILISTTAIASKHNTTLCIGIKKMANEITRLKKLIEGLADRIAAQSELLSNKAERVVAQAGKKDCLQPIPPCPDTITPVTITLLHASDKNECTIPISSTGRDIPWACPQWGQYEHDWLSCPDCLEKYEAYLETYLGQPSNES